MEKLESLKRKFLRASQELNIQRGNLRDLMDNKLMKKYCSTRDKAKVERMIGTLGTHYLVLADQAYHIDEIIEHINESFA